MTATSLRSELSDFARAVIPEEVEPGFDPAEQARIIDLARKADDGETPAVIRLLRQISGDNVHAWSSYDGRPYQGHYVPARLGEPRPHTGTLRRCFDRGLVAWKDPAPAVGYIGTLVLMDAGRDLLAKHPDGRWPGAAREAARVSS